MTFFLDHDVPEDITHSLLQLRLKGTMFPAPPLTIPA